MRSAPFRSAAPSPTEKTAKQDPGVQDSWKEGLIALQSAATPSPTFEKHIAE